MAQTLEVLITVKTCPTPSQKYRETVCTAGVLRNGSYVRLYPIDYRYRPYSQWYSKYQWVRVVAEKNDKDPRPESFRPLPQSQIKKLGRPLGTARKWAERKQFVLKNGVQTMCALNRLSQTQRSLGIVRPKVVRDFLVQSDDRDWSPRQQQVLAQQHLFGPDNKPLEKVPFRFVYCFECEEPGCAGHEMSLLDWEASELWRKMRDKHSDEQIAAQKVREKFFSQMYHPRVDTHFFVGTVLEHGTWVVLGVFWPEK